MRLWGHQGPLGTNAPNNDHFVILYHFLDIKPSILEFVTECLTHLHVDSTGFNQKDLWDGNDPASDDDPCRC